MAEPGVTTDVIDAAAHAAIVEAGACPSPLNYHGFPKVLRQPGWRESFRKTPIADCLALLLLRSYGGVKKPVSVISR